MNKIQLYLCFSYINFCFHICLKTSALRLLSLIILQFFLFIFIIIFLQRYFFRVICRFYFIVIINILQRMSFLRVPPPHTKLTPWVPDLIFIPISRAFERLGVYFYNRVISKTEIGLFDKRWNSKVHGPYCHWRYYGPRKSIITDIRI